MQLGFRRRLLGGCAAAAMLAGCALPQTQDDPQPPNVVSVAVPQSGESQFVFVTNNTSKAFGGSAEVDYWPVGSSGDVAPSGVISGSYTGLSYTLEGIVVDSAGEIYVANAETDSILGFAPNSNGNVSPNITISGSSTGLAEPQGLALDRAGNLYVANCGAGCVGQNRGKTSIEEFAAGSNGNVAPMKVIAGRSSHLFRPKGIAVGLKGDIYVVNQGPTSGASPDVDVFSPHASGDRAPKRVVAGSATELAEPKGIGVDEHGFYVGSFDKSYIERFSRLEHGDARPKAVIEGGHTQLECCLDGITTAPDGSTYVVDRATTSGGSPSPEVLQFGAFAHGNAAPLSNLTGPTTRLDEPLFVFVAGQPSK
jgi:hypothetical protein